MELKNKKILITGGTSGLGYELVKAFLEKGAYVITCGSSEDSANKLKQELNSRNLTIEKCDVSNYKEVSRFIGKIKDLDLLINNAGLWYKNPLGKYSTKEITKMINVNLMGVINVTNLALEKLIKQDRTYIVNVSSTSGIKAKAGSSVYGATKFGVYGFTECIKEELASTNIRVIGFYSGGMKTPMFEKGGCDKDLSKYMKPYNVARILVNTIENPDDIVIDHIIINRAYNK